jgi:Domain of unknown function (DUF4411)
MKAYCLDTSGFSTPLENMPEDIHAALWTRVAKVVTDGKFAVTTEIYEELVRLPDGIGACIKQNKALLRREVEEKSWDWQTYLDHVERMKEAYEAVISEYNGNRKHTVGLNDISIIALAKTLRLPVISSEKKRAAKQSSAKRQKIPDVCDAEGVAHMSFSDFLRAEGIKI